MGEVNEKQTGYKELQNLFKEIARRSALDNEYRELCLKDAGAAVREAGGPGTEFPGQVIFLEEDGDCVGQNGLVFILPPFIKKSWLWNPEKE